MENHVTKKKSQNVWSVDVVWCKKVQCNGQGLQRHKTQGDVENKKHNGKELQNTRPWRKDNVWETKKIHKKKPSKTNLKEKKKPLSLKAYNWNWN